MNYYDNARHLHATCQSLKAPVSGNRLSGSRMRVEWVLESECNNRHVDGGYKVTSMLFVAKAVLR